MRTNARARRQEERERRELPRFECLSCRTQMKYRDAVEVIRLNGGRCFCAGALAQLAPEPETTGAR